MSTSATTYLSILSILLINPLNSQTGKGCAFTTCPQPGQVRIDAQKDSHGNYLSGCNCGCDPNTYCAPPKTINFDPNTLLGDCACGCPSGPPPTCQFPKIYDPTECKCACPAFSRTSNSCQLPQIWREDLCQCSCAIGSPGGPCVQNGQFISNGMVLDDCTCGIECTGIHILDPFTGKCKCPEFMGSSMNNECGNPTIWNEELCTCSCDIGSVGGPCIQNNQMMFGSVVKSDCSCDYNGVQCVGTKILDIKTGKCDCPYVSFMTNKDQCMPPRIWKEDICMCTCPLGSVGGPCIVNNVFQKESMVLNDCTCAYL